MISAHAHRYARSWKCKIRILGRVVCFQAHKFRVISNFHWLLFFQFSSFPICIGFFFSIVNRPSCNGLDTQCLDWVSRHWLLGRWSDRLSLSLFFSKCLGLTTRPCLFWFWNVLYMPVCLSVLSVLSFCRSVQLCVCKSVFCLSVNLFFCLFSVLCLSDCLSLRLSVCPSIYYVN